MTKMLNLTDKSLNRLVMSKKKLPHPDQRLLNGLKASDPNIVQEIKDNYLLNVINFVLKNSGNKSDGKDLFQNALIVLWEKLKVEDVIITVPFGAYFYGFYRNYWLRGLRGNKNISSINELQEFEDESELLVNKMWLKEMKRKIFFECLEQLDDKCRKLLDLSFSGLNATEISKAMKIGSVNAVHQAMYSCREKLKKLVEMHPEFRELEM